MASLPSVMSLGESSLLIGIPNVPTLHWDRLSLGENTGKDWVMCFCQPTGLTSAQHQTVPIINNMGGGFTTLQPISFQQQLHASPQQQISQQLPSHMSASPFMATMAQLPCHSKSTKMGSGYCIMLSVCSLMCSSLQCTSLKCLSTIHPACYPKPWSLQTAAAWGLWPASLLSDRYRDCWFFDSILQKHQQDPNV